jgi:hypothetical protein
MFNKLIPGSVAAGSGPTQKQHQEGSQRAVIAALPPTFRTAEGEQDFRPTKF